MTVRPASFAASMTVQARKTARERDHAQELTDFLLSMWAPPHSVSGRHQPPDLQDLLLVDDLSTKRRFGDAADRCAFIRELHALHPRPRRRALIYATRDPADALEVADRIAVLRRGGIVQCGTPSELRRARASRFVARLFQ